MTVSLDLGWLMAAVLLSVRVAAATAFSAVLGPVSLPGSVRVLLAAGLGVLLASATGAVAPVAGSVIAFTVGCIREIVIGAALGAGFLIAYAATQVAGRILDTQMGFGIASLFNPSAGTISPLTGTLFGMVAVSIFLAMDGHHVLIRALALSVEASPPGASLPAAAWNGLLAQSGIMFSYAVALAAPVMLSLLLADIGLSVFARSMPQLNIFVLGFALKIMFGLMGLAASIQLAQSVFSGLFTETFRYWERTAAGG
jgi:flagellar biosynthetic protein FliR